MLKVITLEGCPPCDQLKALTKELAEAGEIQFIDGMSDEGQRILQENEEIVKAVPFVFVEENGKLRACKTSYLDGEVQFDCGPEPDAVTGD